MRRPSGNMILSVAKCIGNALSTRGREKNTNPRYHWLDYAEAKCGKTLVYDVKCLLKVLVLYVPLPIFWALFDQQGSRWTFQATNMNGEISKYLSIKPDQMQVVNPLIVVFCIPLFNLWIYPLLARMRIRTALQKMTLGMILCGVAFAMSGLLELKLEKSYPVLPKSGEGQLRIFNGHPCSYKIQTNLSRHAEIIVAPFGLWEEKHIPVPANASVRFAYNGTSTNATGSECPTNIVGVFEVVSGKAQSYFIKENGPFDHFEDNPDKPKKGQPLVRLLSPSLGVKGNASAKISLTESESRAKIEPVFGADGHPAGNYLVDVDGKVVGAVELKQGGTYTVMVGKSSNGDYVSGISKTDW